MFRFVWFEIFRTAADAFNLSESSRLSRGNTHESKNATNSLISSSPTTCFEFTFDDFFDFGLFFRWEYRIFSYNKPHLFDLSYKMSY